MKIKNIIIYSVCLLLSCPIFAQNSMKDRTQGWTKEAPMTRGMGGAVTAPTKEDPEGGGVPVGSPAWALILGLGAVYGAYVFNRKRKAVK